MSLEKKLEVWKSRSLITEAQRQQIIAFEKDHQKPLFTTGMNLLGIFIMTLGVISIVSANWNIIPPLAKLIGDFLLLIAVAGGCLSVWRQNNYRWFEGGLLALFMLCGASIGLIGQTFQTNGTLVVWCNVWCIITIPLLFICRQKILPFIWICLFIIGIINTELLTKLQDVVLNWWLFIAYPEVELICFLAIGGLWFGLSWLADYKFRPHFMLFKVSALYGYLMMYFVAVGFMFVAYWQESRLFIDVCIILAVFFAGMAFVGEQKGHIRQLNANIFALFILFLEVYFRVLGNLMTTGIGLIISGAVIIGGLHLVHRIIKKIKTAKEKNYVSK